MDHRILSVVITGGEPFYDTNHLRSILKLTAEYGLVPAIVTNAFWADTPETAYNLLASMPEVKMLSISTDKYHQKFIPVSYIDNALVAVHRLGIACNLSVCIEKGEDEESASILNSLKKMAEGESILISYVYPAGRAKGKRTHSAVFDRDTEQYCCSGAESPIIFPDGRVVGCMGVVDGLSGKHPLLLGDANLRSLAEILSGADQNVFLHMLRLWGPAAVIRKMQESGMHNSELEELAGGSDCDLCYLLAKNDWLLEQLNEILSESELKKKVAYARQFYLGEDSMTI